MPEDDHPMTIAGVLVDISERAVADYSRDAARFGRELQGPAEARNEMLRLICGRTMRPHKDRPDVMVVRVRWFGDLDLQLAWHPPLWVVIAARLRTQPPAGPIHLVPERRFEPVVVEARQGGRTAERPGAPVIEVRGLRRP